MTNNKKTIFIILTLIWTAIIFSFSLQSGDVSSDMSSGFGRWLIETFMPGLLEYMEHLPMEELDKLHFILRKGAHFTEYFLLGILSSASMSLRENVKKPYKGWAAFVYCILVASVDETIQYFVPGRAGRIADVCLDSFGAVMGIILIKIKRI